MKLPWHRMAAVLVAVGFLVNAWLLYRADFPALSTEAQMEAAIADYTSSVPQVLNELRAAPRPAVLHDQVVQGRRIVTFTDRDIDGLLGYVQFRRGLLGGWQTLEGRCALGAGLGSLRVRDRTSLVVFAADCPSEIARYTLQVIPDSGVPLTVGEAGTEPAFFHVHQTDLDPELCLCDAAGRELEAWRYLSYDQDIPSVGITSGDLDVVYWACALRLGIGALLVTFLWKFRGFSRPAVYH